MSRFGSAYRFESSSLMRCPVCEALTVSHFMRLREGDYWRCSVCQATFLDPAQHPSIEAELAEYRLHQNQGGAEGYRQFLSRLAEPLIRQLPPASQGLDFGCGPGPLLAQMMREAGHTMTLYDPVFHADPTALVRQYDFITCTEVIEHFHRPAEEFARLDGILRVGGCLALMTCFQTDDDRFAAWHYRRDPTHVVFYREATIRHLARQYGWICEVPTRNVALLQKVTGARAVGGSKEVQRQDVS